MKGESKQMMTSAVIKNTGSVSKTFGAASFLYCFCSIACEKIRDDQDDEVNTIVGGTVAG